MTYLTKLRKQLSYPAIFLIVTIIMVSPLLMSGKIFATSDWEFHAARVEQIYQNICGGTPFTFVASTFFHHTGAGSFIFYPAFFFYPWALLRLIFNPITSFYLWYGLITYIGFLISFYSMRSFKKNNVTAFIFAIVYILNTYRLLLGNVNTLGEFIAASFLPLPFLGFYQVFYSTASQQKRGWINLAVGMTLLTYAHLLSVLISSEIFLVILFITFIIKKIDITILRLQLLLKAIGAWILLSLPFFYLFGRNYVGQDISTTSNVLFLNSARPLSELVNNSLNNQANLGIGLILLLTIVIGWYPIRKSSVDLSIYLIGTLLFIISSSVFPWFFIQRTPLKVIQLVYRYLSFSSLFLSVVAAEIISIFVKKLEIKWPITLILILLFGGISYVSTQKAYLHNLYDSPATIIKKPQNNAVPLPNVFLNKHNYHKQFAYSAIYGEYDYWPLKTLEKCNVIIQGRKSIINQVTYVNHRSKRLVVQSAPNLIRYQLLINKNNTILDLPTFAYAGTTVTINNKPVPKLTSKRGTILIRGLKKGKTSINIQFNPDWFFYATMIIASVGWILVTLAYLNPNMFFTFFNFL